MPTCPLCATGNTAPAFQKNRFDYHRCRECSTLFVELKISDAVVHEHYGEAYYESEALKEGKRRGYPSYRAGYATLMDGFRQKLEFVRKYVSSGRLLDAGAAYGFFLKAAEPYFECEGIDVSTFAATIARQEFNANVRVGDIENVNVPEGSFDVVVMWDIIEHTIRPVSALAEAGRILKPGGYLFVSTDDVANWLPRSLGRHWWSLAAPLHLCHFSKNGLSIACNRAGLGTPLFFPDPREYTIPEIIKHFGVSYESNALKSIGMLLQKTFVNKLVVRIARPEQFVAVIQKPAA